MCRSNNLNVLIVVRMDELVAYGSSGSSSSSRSPPRTVTTDSVERFEEDSQLRVSKRHRRDSPGGGGGSGADSSPNVHSPTSTPPPPLTRAFPHEEDSYSTLVYIQGACPCLRLYWLSISSLYCRRGPLQACSLLSAHPTFCLSALLPPPSRPCRSPSELTPP